MRLLTTGIVMAAMVAGCGDTARLQVSDGTGPDPKLPERVHRLIPTVMIAPAKGWPAGRTPAHAPGLEVQAFARGLQHPRWLHVLPNGDVLVAETGEPDRPDDEEGFRRWVYRYMLKKSGATGPNANRVTRLRDSGNGMAETSVFLSGLNSPLGMALVGEDFYVANTDAVMRYRYAGTETAMSGNGTPLVSLPAGRRNHHWTKGLVASPDGRKLYVAIGANSDHGEHGIGEEEGRAAIWEVDAATGAHSVFASGIRNPVGMAWVPETGVLWTAVNERDELGSDIVPDYLTSVEKGDFYGWPYFYFGNHADDRVGTPSPVPVDKVKKPKYALGPHTASLGLAWSAGQKLGPQFERGMFVGQHGSWNRNPRSGYKVIFVPFRNGEPSGPPIDVIWGFLDDEDHAMGRPVGVVIDKTGALLVADDVGGVVWRVTASGAKR